MGAGTGRGNRGRGCSRTMLYDGNTLTELNGKGSTTATPTEAERHDATHSSRAGQGAGDGRDNGTLSTWS